jgi:hypothetical protein
VVGFFFFSEVFPAQVRENLLESEVFGSDLCRDIDFVTEGFRDIPKVPVWTPRTGAAPVVTPQR